ncbi:hypothetical protein BOW37_01980 [Solemya velum gill symbiont]|uniref:hypothetical protein n=1 Tax=Solemya velum gill symbiont TaxID=2340 RepID=UPI00099683DB|nr:hypothetical protein [Solemya velum gill symbiont]OOZ45880.1 hypothetical protein BOW37_01980 [Solemya velum gill symbiont]OOZ50812.1 hypothetical protein BOW39_01275 [Solemya velum gill symbiont]OOZ57088.1 hypothetical protein BOW42_04170 [Solemya velum gill symbiont]OOZ62978.1 hypothetical protein BOW44_00405 [Solemya velum gill symbiont]OOZ65518.1 hypothetical protein BOW45_01640 [Solemya velum gill symbiont]
MHKYLPVLLLALLPAMASAGESGQLQEKMIRQWQEKAQELPPGQRGIYLAKRIAALVPEASHTSKFCPVRKNR